MLDFNAPALFDDCVGLGFELHHWREVSVDCVCGPNLRMNDTVQRKPELFDGSQTGDAVLAIAERQDVLCVICSCHSHPISGL